MKRATFCLSALVALIGLSGCGGGGAPRATGGNGRATFTITWPERPSRLIPVAANSIRVTIQDSTGKTWGEQVLARPSTSLTFPSLPVGTLTVTATAYPTSDGTGTAQATATASLAITEGGTTALGVTLASTITRVALSYAPQAPRLGETATLSLAAYDSAGNMVLTSASKWQFSSSNAAIAAVQANGRDLKALALGSVTITATEQESGISAAVALKLVPSTEFYAVPISVAPGFTHIGVSAVNNQGWVAGTLDNIGTGAQRLFLWKPNAAFTGGDFTLLDPLPSTTSPSVQGLSDSGTILVSAFDTTSTAVFQLWQSGTYQACPLPSAITLTEAGDLLGTNASNEPVLRKTDSTELVVPDAALIPIAAATTGYLTGRMTIPGDPNGEEQVWRYKDGAVATALAPAGFTSAQGVAVHRSGTVSVHLTHSVTNATAAATWDGSGSITLLTKPAGYTDSTVGPITDSGVVFGTLTSSTLGTRPARWKAGQPGFLSDLIQPGAPTLTSIQGASSLGYALCQGVVPASTIGVLLIPAERF